MRANVAAGTKLMTDESNVYYKLRNEYDLQRVNHSKDEFVRGDVHVNAVEGMWSLFKRQYHGTHHWISPWHLNAYLDEMCYRYNRRSMHKSVRR